MRHHLLSEASRPCEWVFWEGTPPANIGAAWVSAHFCLGGIGGTQWEAEHRKSPGPPGTPQQGTACLKETKWNPESYYSHNIQDIIEHYPSQKKKEHHNSNEKRKSTDAQTKMNEMLEWADIDFKATIIKMVQSTLVNSLDTNKNNRKSQQRNKNFMY